MNHEPAHDSRERPPQPRPRQGDRPFLALARVLALVGGLSAAVVGTLIAGLSALASLLPGQGALVTSVAFALSIVVASVGLGLAIAWQALQAILGRPSRRFRPPRALPLAVLFLLAVAAGQLVLSLDLLPAVTFPPFHVLAGTLPPLFLLAVAGRALAGQANWREMILGFGSGALLSVPLAFMLEALLILGLALLAAFGVAMRPGGEELVRRLSEVLQSAPVMEDPEALVALARSPLFVAAVIAVVAGAVPLIEEAVKALGVPLLAYRRPGMSQALLWGLAGGAGFALVEGLLNTLGGLEGWALIVLVRLGATLLHCLTGALMGLGWYEGLLRRRWRRTLGLYAGSVAIHAFWNVLSVGVTFLSLGATGPDLSVTATLLSGLGLGLVAGLVGTALVLALGMAGLVHYVRRHEAAAAAAHAGPPESPAPPAGMRAPEPGDRGPAPTPRDEEVDPESRGGCL